MVENNMYVPSAFRQSWGAQFPQGLPAHLVVASWGARAINASGHLDLLPDRQSWEGSFRNDLEYWLNNYGLPAVRIWAKENCGSIYGGGATTIFGPYRDQEYGVFAYDTHGGYIYLRAWEMTDAEANTAEGMKEMLIDRSGVTNESLAYWRANKAKLGTVKAVVSWPTAHGTDDIAIMGTKETMLLTGCTVGYAGEGPRGTATILTELGEKPDKAFTLVQSKRLDWHAPLAPYYKRAPEWASKCWKCKRELSPGAIAQGKTTCPTCDAQEREKNRQGRAAAAPANAPWRPNMNVGDVFDDMKNQALRPHKVIAVLGDEILVEYPMPGGMKTMGTYKRSPLTPSGWRPIAKGNLPLKWKAAMASPQVKESWPYRGPYTNRLKIIDGHKTWWREPTASELAGKEPIALERAASENDQSPTWNSMTYGKGAGYDPKCGSCYLGHAHTTDYHNQNLAESASRAEQWRKEAIKWVPASTGQTASVGTRRVDVIFGKRGDFRNPDATVQANYINYGVKTMEVFFPKWMPDGKASAEAFLCPEED